METEKVETATNIIEKFSRMIDDFSELCLKYDTIQVGFRIPFKHEDYDAELDDSNSYNFKNATDLNQWKEAKKLIMKSEGQLYDEIMIKFLEIKANIESDSEEEEEEGKLA
jgi:hypothetical protein